MPKKRLEVPQFDTEQGEAEFWETHSPFDYNLKLEKVKVKAPKDRPITIRLDSRSRQKLEQLAAAYGMGPSTFARWLIDSALRRLSQKQRPLTIENALELIETLLPKDLGNTVEILEQHHSALFDALEKNSEAREAFIHVFKEMATFLLRVGGLIKTAGFSLEPPSGQSSEKPIGKMAT